MRGLTSSSRASRFGVDEQVDQPDVVLGQVFQPPGGRAGGRAVDVLADGEERPHQVGADEAAGAEHEDGPLEPADLLGEQVGRWSAMVRDQAFIAASASAVRNPTIDGGVEPALPAVELLRPVPPRDVAPGAPRGEPSGAEAARQQVPGDHLAEPPWATCSSTTSKLARPARGRRGMPRGARPSGSSVTSQRAGRCASSSCRTASQMPPTSGPATSDDPAPAVEQLSPGGVRRDRDPRRLLREPEPQVGRVRGRRRGARPSREVRVERRHVGAQVRQAEQGPVVFQGVVRRAHDPIAVTAAVADQHDR